MNGWEASHMTLTSVVSVHLGTPSDYEAIKMGTRYCAVPSAFAANFWEFWCDYGNYTTPAWLNSYLSWGTSPEIEERQCGPGLLHEHFGWAQHANADQSASMPSLRVNCPLPASALQSDSD